MNVTRTALLAALALAWLVAGAGAQDPYAEYNRQRAQRLFLTSPSPHKTYSGYTPGYSRQFETPEGVVREWQSPAYLNERITRRGYERYTGPSERGYQVTPRPVVVVPYYRTLSARPVLPPPGYAYYPPRR